MENQEIAKNIRKIVDVTDGELAHFFNLARFSTIKRNQILVNAGDDPTKIILIKSGCLMTYFLDKNETIHVIQFGSSMWWTGDLQGFTNDEPSLYTVKALADTEAYVYDKDAYHALFKDVPKFERYFRTIYQNSLVAHQKRIISNISYTGEEKYLAFKERYPKLEMIVPQKYVASYIGITPEFLSKLRRRLAGR